LRISGYKYFIKKNSRPVGNLPTGFFHLSIFIQKTCGYIEKREVVFHEMLNVHAFFLEIDVLSSQTLLAGYTG
jgi:hypothetical protein